MKTIRRAEEIIASWHEALPHLSQRARVWLAENIWWVVLVWVIVVIVGMLGALSKVFLGGAVSALLIALGGFAGAALGSFILLVILVPVAFSIANLVLVGLSVSPLKARRRRGWTLLFIAQLINLAVVITRLIFGMTIPAVFGGFASVLLGLYVLFEIRSYFGRSMTAK
jgi:hypothetical protein